MCQAENKRQPDLQAITMSIHMWNTVDLLNLFKEYLVAERAGSRPKWKMKSEAEEEQEL